ncbi:hypothetical protein FAZ15_14605 [Sphingobacterium olei]|uniref:Glycoside hydrolase family 42 N-terminal domain-containing protein n=1 Tax=Sphingobacterium olei TaxID=2571155 RepID=A0A4U0NZ48_9SPHI|nr:hypothetical protein [Sphingobacterium olei]TJZ60109.1 hypothetical protein FAZ15_14605 [Sphingobacterium olei]
MRFFIYFLTFILLLVGEIKGQVSNSNFPILAWGSIPENFTNDHYYSQLKEAGVNLSFSHFHNIGNAVKAMDIAAKYGVKILLYCPELFSETRKTVEMVKDHPGLGGYFLGDEPDLSRFPKLLQWKNIISDIDKSNICYINLFPNYASVKQLGGVRYGDYINRFYSKFDLRVYSFDHYPITNGQTRKDWYGNLEIISSMTKNKNSSFWGFIKIMSIENKSEIISIQDLMLQAFVNLSYGAQGIQYYRYWSLGGTMIDAPMSITGEKNLNYKHLKEVNRYINNLRSVFLNCSVVKIYHTEASKDLTLFLNIPSNKFRLVNGKNLLISEIKNGEKNYTVFVNKSLSKVNQFTIYPSNNVTFIDKELNRSYGKQGVAYTARIRAGEILIMEH